ncbi:MAG: threonine synthase [Oscillospiraceae bacterium]|nr:threonine synthase [Oscillospiraceae bacterium]
MQYISTRGSDDKISAAQAIVTGLSKDGGLFVPDSFPHISAEKIVELATKPYYERAAYIIGLFLTDFTEDELLEYSAQAYSTRRYTENRESGFSANEITPLHQLNENVYFLELWHGPTGAFKDMALQIMPRLLTASLKKTGENRKICILVATSGDTGKAALNGFCDIEGTGIMVFYPRDGVSEVQKLQMTSQKGDNVNVVAVEGNFDDAQTGVKNIFSDEGLAGELNKERFFLSSANSINWGRLVPQIVYYISAYCDLLNENKINNGEKINFCVPTGNFGNILAAYYAEKMGLPINRLICASNRNDVLTQFINTGVYNKNRPFFTTVSPSMDILVSSNLERLLFEISGKNGDTVSSYMESLSKDGFYKIDSGVESELGRIFSSGFCSEEDTMKTIKDTFDKNNYLLDTHTAVAYKVLEDYKKETGDESISVVVSTASPFKFSHAVLNALNPCAELKDDAGLIDKLSTLTGCTAPKPLADIKNEKPRFDETVKVDGMKESVLKFIRRQ